MIIKKVSFLLKTSVIPFLGILLSCTAIVKENHPTTKISIPSEWEEEPVVILSDSLELELMEVGGKNKLIKKSVIWYKIINTSTTDLQTVWISYYPYLSKKPQYNVTAIYNDGKVKNILERELIDSSYDTPSLTGHKEADVFYKITIPNYSVLKYLRIEKKYNYQRVEEKGHFLLRNYRYHTKNKRISMIWPTGYTINYGFENRESLKVKTSKQEFANRNVFSISAENLEEIEEYYNHKYPELWYAALMVSFPPDGNRSYTWNEIGKHYFGMIYDSIAKHDTTIIDSIAKGLVGSTEEIIIENAFNLVRDKIRYYGSWESSYGWIPRDPKTIFEKGYGDCKEMANVLAMILRKKGFNSYLVLLKRKGGFKFIGKYPTLDLTNHVITCLEKKNGQKLYLDPTSKRSYYNTSYCEYLNNPVLVISEKNSHLDTIKADPGYQYKIETNSEIIASSQGKSWKIKGTAHFSGRIAENIYWWEKNRGNLEKSKVALKTIKYFLKMTARTGTFTKITPSEVSIDFSADFSPNILTTPANGIVFSQPSIFTPRYYFGDLSYEGNRYLHEIEQIDTWEIPKGFGKLNLSDFKHQFGSGIWKQSGNTITRNYSCKFSHIEASERKTLKRFFNERSNFERGIAWFN